MGGAYVEIFAKDGAFMQAMTRVQNRIKSVASAMQAAGRNMAFGGTAIGAPMLLAIKQAATFEDALLGMRSAAGLTEKQVGTLRQQALALGQAMNASPTKVAGAFLELTKAGMSVDEVLKGAGQSSIEFARVSGVEMADAAVFMKVAMQSFGVSAQEAVDTLSAAADSSETSIASMVESFGLVGSAGALFNQSLFDLAQGMAALARFSIIGEEAGTGIKSILNSLVAPSGVAQDALESLGLTVDNFRGADKKMLPLVQIVGV
jgi:TP901 family phage tail tape measure protein